MIAYFIHLFTKKAILIPHIICWNAVETSTPCDFLTAQDQVTEIQWQNTSFRAAAWLSLNFWARVALWLKMETHSLFEAVCFPFLLLNPPQGKNQADHFQPTSSSNASGSHFWPAGRQKSYGPSSPDPKKDVQFWSASFKFNLLYILPLLHR